MIRVSTGEVKWQLFWTKSWLGWCGKVTPGNLTAVVDSKSCLIWNVLRGSPVQLIYGFAFAWFTWFHHTALRKRESAVEWTKGMQSQCTYVLCKIKFNRPKNKTQTNWYLEVLGEQPQHGVCCGVWKRVQVLGSNERIRDVQMNVLFACLDSSHVQISSRFESWLFAHFQSWSHTDLLS